MPSRYLDKSFCIEVSADFACFTRPEMKVERVSYDVPTPSAVRAVFEAIFWKPAVRWKVRKVDVLHPIKWTSVRRNEVGAVMSDRADGLFIEENRQQRAGLFLRDVRYRFHADLMFIPPAERKLSANPLAEYLVDAEERPLLSKDENPGKYNAIFERRARKGQCFNQPYLGCREFSCAFRFVDNIATGDAPIPESRDLGFMLYDIDFSDPKAPKPAFFRAKLENGVLMVPDWESKEVKR
jgi:CRISPR-associated protein Cas5d